NRARELEAAEPGGAGAVQRDGVRRPAPHSQHISVDLDRSQLAAELEHELVDAVVRREQVRAEADGRDTERALLRPGEKLLHLSSGRGPREGARRTARAQRGEPGELDALLDLHASASRISSAARSTSPAPSVRTVSPGRAQPATSCAASSSDGAQPMRMPGRARASSSTISRPVTPGTGSSRAG